MKNALEIQFAGITFRNPVVVASTDIGRRSDSFEAFARAGVGGIVTKSVTDATPLQKAGITMFDIRDTFQQPVRGDLPDQYSFFSRGGAMISMEDFLPQAKEQLEIARRYGVVAIGSISASRLENWVAYAEAFQALGYPMVELNFGNPHGEAAKQALGFLIGQSPALCLEIATAVLRAVQIPVVVKLTPQITDLAALTVALKKAGVQGVTITHRFQGLVVDRETETPVLGGFAAIGGPWMKPLTLANVARVYRASGLAIMGGNGADTAEDILDFLYAGASLVQIGSSMMLRGPDYAADLLSDLAHFAQQKEEPLSQLCGRVASRIIPYQNLGEIPARRAKLATQICANCSERPCLNRCYFGALSLEGNEVTHHEDFCSGCGMCLHVCPHAAVEIEPQS